MPVSFQQIPANWRQPLYYVEVDPSQAGLPVQRPAALLIGHPLSSAAIPRDIAHPVGSEAEVVELCGQGSMLHLMARRFFANNFAQLLYVLPVPEPAGAKSTGSITVTHAPSQAGVLYLYIAGQRISVPVNADDTADAVMTAITGAINSAGDLPVTAVAGGPGSGQVTITCKWNGITGDDVDLRDSYYGKRGGEVVPLGMTLSYANSGKLVDGAGVPDFTNSLANLGDEQYEYVALPFMDTGSFIDWDAEYGFSDTGRWGWLRQLYGHIFGSYRASFSDLIGWGQGNNSGIISVMAIEPDVPNPIWEVAAAYASKAGRALLNDPARPLQTLELNGILPAPTHKRFITTQRNELALTGLATQFIDGNGFMAIARESTTYQQNVYGQSDDAYELVTTLATLARLFRNQKQAITSKWPRHKLADDGTRFGVGQAIVTPSMIRAELIAEYAEDEFNGLVENLAAFKTNLVVERDPNDVNRANVIYPPDLVNQLREFMVLAQFRLQYNRGVDQVVATA